MELTSIVRNDAIAREIAEGVAAQKSALDMIRNAAIEFVELIPRDYETVQIPDIVKHGRDLYRAEFDGDHNLSAWFGDVATLAMAGSDAVSFETTKTVDGKKEKVEVHTTGAQAARTLSKHPLKAAAKAARDDLEIGRATGGGRKPNTPTDAPAQVTHVFSLVELQSQLAGLFGNSKNPMAVLNKALAQYHVATVSSADLEAFNKWKKANTKKAA